MRQRCGVHGNGRRSNLIVMVRDGLADADERRNALLVRRQGAPLERSPEGLVDFHEVAVLLRWHLSRGQQASTNSKWIWGGDFPTDRVLDFFGGR